MKGRIAVAPGATAFDGEGYAAMFDGLETHGFDTVWLSDIPLGAAVDPIVGLSFAASRTRRPRKTRDGNRPPRPGLETLEDRCLLSAGFRSFDGSGNNLLNPAWGQAGTDLLRAPGAAAVDITRGGVAMDTRVQWPTFYPGLPNSGSVFIEIPIEIRLQRTYGA